MLRKKLVHDARGDHHEPQPADECGATAGGQTGRRIFFVEMFRTARAGRGRGCRCDVLVNKRKRVRRDQNFGRQQSFNDERPAPCDSAGGKAQQRIEYYRDS